MEWTRTTTNDSNVFPDPHDSVTDSNMNPEIVTNDHDVRQRVVSKSQSKSREHCSVSRMYRSIKSTPHVKMALGSSPNGRLDWWRNASPRL